MTSQLKFKTAYKLDADQWTRDGQKIGDPAVFGLISTALSQGSILLVEHWHYRGARAPDRVVVTDVDELLTHLMENAMAGDAIYVFDITTALENGKEITHGKCPDEQDEVPLKGAY